MAPRGRSKAATARSVAASKGWATRKANALRAVRAEAARKGWATRKAEAARRSTAAGKGWETRRARQLGKAAADSGIVPTVEPGIQMRPGRRRWYEEIDEIEQPGKEKGYKAKGKGK